MYDVSVAAVAGTTQVEMSGHTKGARLGVLASRPCAVQVCANGAPTGATAAVASPPRVLVVDACAADAALRGVPCGAGSALRRVHRNGQCDGTCATAESPRCRRGLAVGRRDAARVPLRAARVGVCELAAWRVAAVHRRRRRGGVEGQRGRSVAARSVRRVRGCVAMPSRALTLTGHAL